MGIMFSMRKEIGGWGNDELLRSLIVLKWALLDRGVTGRA
jgi:hypothetical protein